MDAQDQMHYLNEQVKPRLNEVGLESYVIIGYLRKEDGQMERVCIVNCPDDPMARDAIRPVVHFAHVWGRSDIPPAEP